jgi:hypothetical protein
MQAFSAAGQEMYQSQAAEAETDSDEDGEADDEATEKGGEDDAGSDAASDENVVEADYGVVDEEAETGLTPIRGAPGNPASPVRRLKQV